MYHNIIRILTSQISRIPGPSYGFNSYEKQDGCHHCSIERDTRPGVAMETFDNYQHTYMCMLIIIRIMDIIKK